MNSPQAKLKRARDAEAKEATDLKAFKADLLSKVIVKTIVKEQTNTQSVTALQFNHLPFAAGAPGASETNDTNLGNLFATCGGDFATVYDDEHFGEHVAVVAQFKNEATRHTAAAKLNAVAWVDARGFTRHEFGMRCSRWAAGTTTPCRSSASRKPGWCACSRARRRRAALAGPARAPGR